MKNNCYVLDFFSEPLLEFAHSQKSDYCKDGLFLYGPLQSKPDVSYGIIGHEDGIKRFEKWLNSISTYIQSADVQKLHFSSFPGFQTIFNSKFRLVEKAKLFISKEKT